MTGRKRTPAKITALRGNPGHRKRTAEPQFDTAIPDAPAVLDKEGQREWTRITSLMSNAGMMTPAYRGLLTIYCQTWSEYVKLMGELEGQPRWAQTPNGYEYENPRFIRVGKVRDQFSKLCAELGITPVTLSKAHMVGKPDSPQTKQQALAEKLFQVPVKK